VPGASPDREVRRELAGIIDFWILQGIFGYRMDAVPFVIEPSGARGIHPGPQFEYLAELRKSLSWRNGDAILLGEANVDRGPPAPGARLQPAAHPARDAGDPVRRRDRDGR